jgi:hypothetical protein
MLTTRQHVDSLKARLDTTLAQLEAVRRQLRSQVHPYCEAGGICAICLMLPYQPGFNQRHNEAAPHERMDDPWLRARA